MSSISKRNKKALSIAPTTPDDAPAAFKITDEGSFHEGNVHISQSGLIIGPDASSADDINIADLEVIKSIGRGSAGVVQKVLHRPTGAIMALKIQPLEVNTDARKQILLELKTLYSSQSPYIIAFYGAFFIGGHIHVCMELMDGGSLNEMIHKNGAFSEEIVAYVTTNALKGLRYLHHEQHLIHRDIKPHNILVNSRGQVKLTDFGVSGQLATSISSTTSWVGTVTYMSPERIQGKDYSTKSDIWSLGISVMEMSMGTFPYRGEGGSSVAFMNFFDLLDLIVHGDVPRLPDTFSPELCSFCQKCLEKSTDRRQTASELLQHPFITAHEEDNFDMGEWVRSHIEPEDVVPVNMIPSIQEAAASSPQPRTKRMSFSDKLRRRFMN